MNTATDLSRKEVVAVLIELNKKVDQCPQPTTLYGRAQLAIFMELRDYYRHQLVALDNGQPYHAIAA